MATFKFGRYIDIHWNGYDIQGPADTVFSIPDQLYEEFDADIAPVEPTLQWIDTNEFLTLSNSVSVSQLQGTFPISVTTTTSGKNVAISSSTNPAGYTMVADGSGGVIFQAASTGALTSIVGVAPMSTIISGNTASVILDANYQTAGTYVTSVVGTSPVSASGTTAITVSVDQSLLSVADAVTATTLRTYVKNSSGSTITKGQAVYVTGADGTNALIGLASASADPTSSKTLGIAASTMTNNAFGYVIENGQLSNIDTSSATAGSSIWLGSTPGSLVFNNPPAEPDHAVYLGVVTKANASTGEILVKVQNGYELDELHDVFVGGVSTALPLVYSSASSGWVAQALTSVGIADAAVTSAKIADNAIVAAKIATGAVGSSALASGSVNSSILANNAVVAASIAAAAVGTAALTSGSATNGQVLTANGSGGATYQSISAREAKLVSGITTVSTSSISSFTGQYMLRNLRSGPIDIVVSSVTSGVLGNGFVNISSASNLTKIIKKAPFIDWSTYTSSLQSTGTPCATDGKTIVSADTAVAGTIIISSDARTFSTANIGSGTYLFAYYGGGLFVVGGTSGNLYTSPNGVTWTARTSGFSTTTIRWGTYGNGTHVIIGDSGKLSYSTNNGVTWTNTSPFAVGNETVKFGNGLFIVVGSQYSGTPLYTSTNATSWTQRATGTGGASLKDSAYGTGGWIAISNSTCSKSIDGVSWTSSNNVTGTYIDFVNTYWIAYNGATAKVSSDGTNWTQYTTTNHNGKGVTYYQATDEIISAGGNASALFSFLRTSSGAIDVEFLPISYQSITA